MSGSESGSGEPSPVSSPQASTQVHVRRMRQPSAMPAPRDKTLPLASTPTTEVAAPEERVREKRMRKPSSMPNRGQLK